LSRIASYSEKDFNVDFWRTKGGSEVDFVLNDGEVTIEVKGTNKLRAGDIKWTLSFSEDFKPKKSFIVCQEPVPRKITPVVDALPWKHFLEMLWNGGVC
jgi:predicted AAA+ superfamily ATPase